MDLKKLNGCAIGLGEYSPRSIRIESLMSLLAMYLDIVKDTVMELEAAPEIFLMSGSALLRIEAAPEISI